MKNPEDYSPDDLRALMIEHLEKRGESPEFVRGYIAAQERFGLLRPRCPAWMRNSAALFYLIPISEPTTPKK